MSAVKSFALGALILGASATLAKADPLLSNGDGTWSFWMKGAAVSLSSQSPPSDPASTPAPAPTPPPAPEPTPPPPPPPAPSPPPAPAPPAPASIPPGTAADAFINLSNPPYPEANMLTTGNGQPWYNSPAVQQVFGGVPNAQQQADFANAVLADVQQTYQLSGGLAPKLTIDPNVPAHHTLSVVSGTSFGSNPDAVGITDVGNNGFSFIDKLPYAQSVDQLEWAVAHNVAHELMHAFGVSAHDDTTGNFLDSAVARWELLTDPNARFSDQAINDIRNTGFGPNSAGVLGAQVIDGAMELLAPQPVPEPATIALWTMAAAAGIAIHRHRKSRTVASIA